MSLLINSQDYLSARCYLLIVMEVFIMQNNFQFFITKIVHGVGSSKSVGDIAKKLGALE